MLILYLVFGLMMLDCCSGEVRGALLFELSQMVLVLKYQVKHQWVYDKVREIRRVLVLE
jgi:uncharacterized membrane protein